jgi:hypothetical protein
LIPGAWGGRLAFMGSSLPVAELLPPRVLRPPILLVNPVRQDERQPLRRRLTWPRGPSPQGGPPAKAGGASATPDGARFRRACRLPSCVRG